MKVIQVKDNIYTIMTDDFSRHFEVKYVKDKNLYVIYDPSDTTVCNFETHECIKAIRLYELHKEENK